jgi:hypothetical protein
MSFRAQHGSCFLGFARLGTQGGFAGLDNPSHRGRSRPGVHNEWTTEQLLGSAHLQAGSKQGVYERNGFHGRFSTGAWHHSSLNMVAGLIPEAHHIGSPC